MQKYDKRSKVLIIDAFINLLLGILLLLGIPYGTEITEFLGVPQINQGFYASILGAIFIGIAIALWVESNRINSNKPVGLGLGGAIAINMSGGVALIGWLIFGKLELPLRGYIIFWTLAIILILISVIEWYHFQYKTK